MKMASLILSLLFYFLLFIILKNLNKSNKTMKKTGIELNKINSTIYLGIIVKFCNFRLVLGQQNSGHILVNFLR